MVDLSVLPLNGGKKLIRKESCVAIQKALVQTCTTTHNTKWVQQHANIKIPVCFCQFSISSFLT